MRLLISPPEMLLPNGDINQEYFRPLQVRRGAPDAIRSGHSSHGWELPRRALRSWAHAAGAV